MGEEGCQKGEEGKTRSQRSQMVNGQGLGKAGEERAQQTQASGFDDQEGRSRCLKFAMQAECS